MSTITKEFTKERLEEIAEDGFLKHGESKALARIALASLEAEPVSFDDLRDAVAEVSGGPAMEWSDIYKGHQAVPFINFNSLARIVDKFRTAPPAPVSVPDGSAVELLATDLMKRIDKITGERHNLATLSSLRVSIVEACRTAMLQGAEQQNQQQNIPENIPTLRDWLAAIRSSGVAIDAKIILSERDSLNSPVIPDGWVMVPVEPTHEMLEAGDEQFGTYDVYRRMIAAAPQQEVK